MNGRREITGLRLIALALTVFFSAIVWAEGHHHKNDGFTVSELRANLFLLQGRGGNIVVSQGADGLLMIDSEYSDLSPALEKTLQTFDGALAYVINTHWHGDHTQGNQHFGHQATVVAHERVRQRLSTRQEVKLFKMVSEPYPAHALPTLTFNNRLSLHVNGEQIDVLHLPHGHTDSDSVIFFEKANVVHMGDHYFNGMFPFVDVDSNGDVRGLADNIATVLSRINEQTLVVPGHGPLSNKKELQAFHRMLLGTIDEVQALMANKHRLESIQTQGLSARWARWGKGFLSESVWIGIVFDSLSKSAADSAQ